MDMNSGSDSNSLFHSNELNEGFDDMDCVDVSSKLWIPECENKVKPYVSQLFDSVDSAFSFYTEYGRLGGFNVRKSSHKRFKDGTISIKYFLCSQSGVGDNSCSRRFEQGSDMSSTSKCNTDKGSYREDDRVRRTLSLKVDCNAKIGIRFAGLKGYEVYMFVEGHNHPLTSESGKQFLRANRNMYDFQQRFIFDANTCNIGATKAYNILKAMSGVFGDVGASNVEFKNWVRDIKAFIGKHDADMIIQKFQNKHETSDKSFVYEYKTDSDGHLIRIFWADGYGRKRYKVYGDVVSFDATYRTNKYNMVFVPFIGIDNHWRSVTFAAALLAKEDTENFEWVFDAFLKVMNKPPKCIITDQCPALKLVVPMKFPDSAHRLCMWHIMKNFPSKLGTVFCAESLFMEKLNKFVWNDYISIIEFESGWKSVLKEFGLEDNVWLSEMFDLRKSWIPAYFRDDAMVGLLRTTSRSEGSNFYFNHFVQKGDTLCEFYFCYESAIEKQRHTNNRLNDEDRWMPRTVTPKYIEKDAAGLYTRSIFYKVQEKIKSGCFDMELDSLTVANGVKKFVIKDRTVKGMSFEVVLVLETNNVSCSCKLYIRVGYLCSHCFFCLSMCGIDRIPRELLSSRWVKNAEDRHSILGLGDIPNSDMKEDRLKSKTKNVWFEFQGCLSDVSCDEELLDCLLKKLVWFRAKVREKCLKKHVQTKSDLIEQLIGSKPVELVTVLPPHKSNNKGSRKRIVSSAEKGKKKGSRKPIVVSELRSKDGRNRISRTCRFCKASGFHDSRNCPKKKNAEENQNADKENNVDNAEEEHNEQNAEDE